jgi:hypothetical protein
MLAVQRNEVMFYVHHVTVAFSFTVEMLHCGSIASFRANDMLNHLGQPPNPSTVS